MKLFVLGGPVYLIVRPGDLDPAAEGGGTPVSLERYREVFSNESFLIFEILPGFE